MSRPSVLVLGAGGMLGHKLVQELVPTMDVTAGTRRHPVELERLALLPPSRCLHVDAGDADSLALALDTVQPSVVINAVGVIKQSPGVSDGVNTIRTNALFPHEAHALCERRGVRFIHLSTDCVFAGDQGNYAESDWPDARDLYGRSKLLGEVDSQRALTLRTSMIGREISGHRALIDWFLSQQGRVTGYSQAIFSGLTTRRLARLIGEVITDHPALSGLYHVAADPIDKLALLTLVRDAFELPVELVPDATVRIDRSLDGSRFRAATGFVAPDWPTMIAELHADSTPYPWRAGMGATA